MIKLDQNRFYTIGHRGMEKGEVENSLKAFSKAIELGLDFVEMDLQITKDDKIIVFHDRNLKKKTSLRGKPKDFTLEKIKDTHIETEAGKDKIPTLEQVFKLVKNQDRIIISSFSYEYLENFKLINPNIFLTWLIKPKSPIFLKRKIDKILKTQKEHQMQGISLHISNLSKKTAQLCKQKQIFIFVWGIRNKEDYKYCLSLSINGFTAPDPEYLLKILN